MCVQGDVGQDPDDMEAVVSLRLLTSESRPTPDGPVCVLGKKRVKQLPIS